jgi:AcrR family transcriptional regulator
MILAQETPALDLDRPAVGERRQRRREVRTEHVLAVATGVFEREGLAGLTLGRVARELDLVPAALYRYFESKDALVAAMQRRAVVELSAGFRRHLAEVAGPLAALAPKTRALASVLAMGRFYEALPRTQPEAWRLVAVLLGDPQVLLPDEQARQVLPHVAEFLSAAEEVVAAAVQAGALDGAREGAASRTVQLWAALHGALTLEKLARFAGPRREGVDSVAMALVTDLLRGWGADPATLGRARRALDAHTEDEAKEAKATTPPLPPEPTGKARTRRTKNPVPKAPGLRGAQT